MKPFPLGELLALPLQSAIRAQNLALQETLSFIEDFGLEAGVAKTFRLKAERLVEERIVDPETGKTETQFSIQPFEVSIPLLAIIPLASVQLQEMNVEFGVDVVEPKSEPIKSTVIPAAVKGVSLAPSLSLYAALAPAGTTTMKVNMKIGRETPEGLARLGDLLTDLLSGQTAAPPKSSPPPLKNIPGISPRLETALQSRGIATTQDFLAATATTETTRDLSKSVGVSERRIKEIKKNINQSS